MVSNLNLLESRRRILLNTPHIETISDTIASFETDVATKIKGCKIHFTPIQEGEGDPSPENVRPITGWDGVTVTRCGKNLYNPATVTMNMEIGDDGQPISTGSSNNWCVSDYIPVKPNTTYTATALLTRGSGRIAVYDENKVKTSGKGETVGADAQTVINTGSTGRFVRLTIRIGDGLNTVFEEGSATDYEPYNGTTLTIPFPQTIYGGYVDLVNGEVVEEYGSADLSTIGFAQYSTTNHCWSNGITNMVLGNKLGAGSLYCDSYKPYPTASILWGGINLAIWGYNTTQRKVIIRNDAYRGEDNIYDMTTFLESLKGAMLYYPLAIPNTYQITPQTLKALRGMNNIWSDANGNIEVSFYTH